MTLQSACKQLLIKYPFYGMFLLGINKHFGEDSETACVCLKGTNLELSVNESFWNTLTDDEQLAILTHEVYHIVFKHMLFFNSFDNKELLNIAADCEVNSYIDILQRDPYCYAAKFKCNNCLGTKQYYEIIGKNTDYVKIYGDIKSTDSHESWKDFGKLSDAEKDLIGSQIDYNAKNVTEQVRKINGSVPSELKDYLDSLFKQKEQIFNWKSYFKRFIGSVIDINLKYTHKKESIRFSGSAGIKHNKKSNILIAIDTSGSVDSKDLCDFFSEIAHIKKAGTDVTILEFDYKVQNIYKYKNNKKLVVTGRGGTDFYPAWEYYIKHKREYNMLIVFTDGYAPTSGLKPIMNVLWVITNDGERKNYPGKIIYIPKR